VYNGARVAVKKSSILSRDKTAIMKERRLLGSLPPHPHVVHVLGICEDAPDGQLLLVMEYATHGNVQIYLQALTEGGKVCLK
jgi:serine/threonine protein kinase